MINRFAHRRAASHASEITVRRRLSVLRRADEKTAASITRMESQPRPTAHQTHMFLTDATHPIPLTDFFPIHGQGDGESCPQQMKSTVFIPPPDRHRHPSTADHAIPKQKSPESTTQAHLLFMSGAILATPLKTQNA